MPTLYMTSWSVVMIGLLHLTRLRSWRDAITVLLITGLVLMISQALFLQFAMSANLDASMALLEPSQFITAGPYGWLALLVMPCGWLGPVIGINLVQRWRLLDSDAI